MSYLFIFLTNFWVYHFFQVYHVFSDSGSFQCTQMDVFWCPGDPGTIPDWSWIDLGKIIFSWKFSKFWPTWVSLLPKKLICISKPWTIWEFPDLDKLKISWYNEIHQILTDRLAARGKPSTWLPRGGLLEQILCFLKFKRSLKSKFVKATQYTTPQASSTVQQDTIPLEAGGGGDRFLAP